MSDPQEIRSYWEDRAASADPAQATTNDIYLRELEVATLIDALKALGLPSGFRLLDVGCGDGASTIRLAEAIEGIRVRGLDYAASMIALAERRLADSPSGLRERVQFGVGDATRLDEACGDERFDVVTTDRCLINLPSAEAQRAAIAAIAERLRPGGWYVAIENFIEGHNAMNAARRAVDLPEIPVRWHNRFFTEDEFRRAAEARFADLQFRDFASSYYFATRVVYSAACRLRGDEPDYRHPIHRIAGRLPWTGRFSPIRMAVLRRPGQ